MQYASFWKRTAAYLVDSLIYSVLCVGIYAVLILGFVFSGAFAKEPTLGQNLLMGAASLAAYLGYYVWPESSQQQATLGKRLFGLRVMDENGQRISFARSLGRNLGMYISALIACIGYLMCFWTEKRQCLHDKLAGCLVVDEHPNEKQGCMIGVIVFFFALPFAAGILGIVAAIAFPQFFRAIEQGRARAAASALEQARSAQHAFYQEHHRYATQWNQLGFAPCSNEESNRCTLKDDFTLELESQGVAAQRNNEALPYRLFRAYDLKDTRRSLVCISKQQHVKSFCQDFMRRAASLPPGKR